MGLGPEEMCEQVNFMLKDVMELRGWRGRLPPQV